MGGDRAKIEGEVRGLIEAQDWDRATARALEAHGTEVLELLVALHRDETEAGDAFSLFAEGVWRGLPRFAWECALRTWLYAIAKRCSMRVRRDGRRRAARETALPDTSSASVLVAQIRSRTATFLRTERRSRIAALRETLPIDDQAVLMLRVDRGLDWNELARVMAEDALDGPSLKREAARLRKRFQLIKEKLHALAKQEGLE